MAHRPATSQTYDETHTPEGVPVPAFTPWLAQRRRDAGWSPDAQRAFIYELTRIGSARAAAHAVGKSVRSAYQLRDKPGAESFAAAWATAVLAGRAMARDTAISRALHGEVVPRFRRGRFEGFTRKHNDRLLIAALTSHQRDGVGWDSAAPLNELRYRLEQWEAALRRAEMDAADGTAAAREASAEAWDDHVARARAVKSETRRARDAAIRTAVRREVNRSEHVGSRIRVL